MITFSLIVSKYCILWTPTKIPVMSCPLGAECNNGLAGAIWKTDDVAAELIAIALEAAEKLIRPKSRSVTE